MSIVFPRYCGASNEAVVQVTKMEGLLLPVNMYSYYAGVALSVDLTLWKKARVPRWGVPFCPALITGRLDTLIVYVPAPLGFPLYGRRANIVDMTSRAVLALTRNDSQQKLGKE